MYSTHIDHRRMEKNGASEVLNLHPKRTVAPLAKLRDTDNVATHELTSHQHAALACEHLSSPQDNGNFFSSLLATDVSTSPPSTPPSASQKRKESPGTTTRQIIYHLECRSSSGGGSMLHGIQYGHHLPEIILQLQQLRCRANGHSLLPASQSASDVAV